MIVRLAAGFDRRRADGGRRAEVLAHAGRDPPRRARRSARTPTRCCASSPGCTDDGDRARYETPASSRERASKNSIGGSARVDLRRRPRASSSLRLALVVVGERPRRRAELDHDPVRVVRVDRRAPAVVDAHDVVAVREPAVLAGVEVVEVGARTRCGSRSSAGRGRSRSRDRSRRASSSCRSQNAMHLAVAGVVEEVARPAVLEERDDVDLHELEAHRLGVEAVARFEVAGARSRRGGKPCAKSATLWCMDSPLRPGRSVDPDPLVQFRRWYDEAVAAGVRQPDAMTLATVSPSGASRGPHGAAAGPRRARVRVLHEPGERQGRAARREPRRPRSCSTGAKLERQVRVTGPVSRLLGRRRDAVLGAAAAGPPAERVGVAAERGRRRRRRSRRGSRRSRRASRTTIRRCRRSGAATSSASTSSSCWQGRKDRLHDRVRYRPGDGAGCGSASGSHREPAGGGGVRLHGVASRSATGRVEARRRHAARVRLQTRDAGRADRRRRHARSREPARATGRVWFVAALVFSLAGDVFLMLPRDAFVAGPRRVPRRARVLRRRLLDRSTGGDRAGHRVDRRGARGRADRAHGRCGALASEPALRPPVAVYMVVISAMVASAIASGNVVAAVGAVLFAASPTASSPGTASCGRLAWAAGDDHGHVSRRPDPAGAVVARLNGAGAAGCRGRDADE